MAKKNSDFVVNTAVLLAVFLVLRLGQTAKFLLLSSCFQSMASENRREDEGKKAKNNREECLISFQAFLWSLICDKSYVLVVS